MFVPSRGTVGVGGEGFLEGGGGVFVPLEGDGEWRGGAEGAVGVRLAEGCRTAEEGGHPVLYSDGVGFGDGGGVEVGGVL